MRQKRSVFALLSTVVLVFYSACDGNGIELTQVSPDPAPTPPNSSFSLISNMVAARGGHSATLLPDGRVLIAGGDGAPSSPAGRTAEIYDPATGRFSPTGSMNSPRAWHSAVLLPNGKVFIVGPSDSSGAELYDPATGEFQVTGKMLPQEDVASAALLANGNVLVAGDSGAQLYDPNTETFHPAGGYATGAAYLVTTVVALPDGRALVLGTNPPQLYDPAHNVFSPTGSSSALDGDLYSATLLTNGKVLVAGGTADDVFHSNLAMLYDPATGSFEATGGMSVGRDAHAAVRLLDGPVLIVGGDGGSCDGNVCKYSGSVAAAELYDPISQTFAPAGLTNVARTEARATVLQNGDVLITGGWLYCGIGCFHGSTATAEIYHVK